MPMCALWLCRQPRYIARLLVKASTRRCGPFVSFSDVCCVAVQAAQVYAASIMFGYFVRRVDKRFQLERQLGLQGDEQKDAVARLERMFNTAGEEEQDLDRPASSSSSSSPSTSGGGEGGAGQREGGKQGEGGGAGKKESPLRKYIESFDQATLADMTRQVVRPLSAVTLSQTTKRIIVLYRKHQASRYFGKSTNSCRVW